MTTEEDDNFLSKISMEHKDDDDNVIDSILNKDDENISKSDLDGNIATLIEKLQSLDLQESIIPEKAKNKAEQHAEERKIRYKRKGIQEKLKILCYQREIKKCKSNPATPKKKTRAEGGKIDFTVPKGKLDSLTLDEKKESEYYRLLTIADSYHTRILNLYEELDLKLDDLDESLSQYEREEKQLEINSKIETLKSFLQEYQKRNNELQLIADVKDTPKLLTNLENILDTANLIFCKIKSNDEKMKQKMALAKSEQLEGMKLSKFTGTGEQKFLNYYSFYQELNELVLSKPYSDSTKLRYLKQYVDNDAKEIVKNYHSGTELRTALNALEETYGRSDMVIRETLKSIQKLQSLTMEHNVRANKAFLYKITTIVSTLKVHNFEIDSDQSENSAFMINIEEKLPQETFLKWEDRKMDLKKANKNVSIEEFIQFFSEKVKKEENVHFIKGSSRVEGDKGPSPRNKVKMYQTKFREKKPNGSPRGNTTIARNKPYNSQPNWQRNNGSQSNKPLYCVFCEVSGSHSTGWCKVQKYTKAYKEGKLLKHNCCFSCLKTTDHKADTCPYRKECGICRRFHHFNIHPREDVIKYYKNKGQHNQ